VLSQFRTPYCTNLRQYSKRSKGGGAHYVTMHRYQITIFASNFCARKMCRSITLQTSVAIATCRKACFPQIVLLHYKAKQYLGFRIYGVIAKFQDVILTPKNDFKKNWPGGSEPCAAPFGERKFVDRNLVVESTFKSFQFLCLRVPSLQNLEMFLWSEQTDSKSVSNPGR